MRAPPSLTIVPPALAVVAVKEVTPSSETDGVVADGGDGGVVTGGGADAVVKLVSSL
jgi:hypothetical protein